MAIAAQVGLALVSLGALFGCAGPTAYRGQLIQPPASASAVANPNVVAASATSTQAIQQQLKQSTEPYLKCHFWDGSLILLENWRVEGETVLGRGLKYDAKRASVGSATNYRIPIATVALFETNRPEAIKSARVPVMAVVATTSLALTALCITTPKACFGSCPTIYATDGHDWVLQAEGFSSSIAKALEAVDVDALTLVPEPWSTPTLRVTNEAPETHAIRSLTLLYAPRPVQGRVYRSGDRFYAGGNPISASRCTAETGDCLAEVRASDDLEYKSETDGVDLAAREQVYLEFAKVPAGELGLVLTARNTLLNTYLFYQALAYMGENWGDYLTLIERGDQRALQGSRRIGELLGGIQVEVEQGKGHWVASGEHLEIGPIAKETALIRLATGSPRATPSAPLRIRLNMTRGNMRLDRVAVVPVLEEVTPRRLSPESVLRGNQSDPEALARLLDPDRYLVTYPNDEYTVTFPDPHCARCEWFVESRGYYYEWMRQVWLPEQDLAALARLLITPETALRALAPAYRKLEPEIDRIFWQSRLLQRGPEGRSK